MKTFLLTVISFFALQTIYAQTAADYFLPLCVGNYIKLHVTGNNARTTYYRIEKAETINNETYYGYRGSDFMDHTPVEENFNYSWLRKDATGNIIIGAYDPTGNGNLSSAITTLPFGYFFPNQFLTLGYSRSFVWGNELQTESVVSVSATVGIYTNCIQIRNTVEAKGIIQRIDDSYYAYLIGLISEERVFPTNEARVSNMVDFNSTNCYSTGISDGIVNEKEISIYPNPSKDKMTLNVSGNDIGKNMKLFFIDFLGRKVKEVNINSPITTIRVEELPSGIYLYQLCDERNAIKAGKIIIE